MTGKRLYKSRDKKVSGVCGGIAEYFGVDPIIVRLIWAFTFLATGAGLVAYIIAAIVMDESPEYVSSEKYSPEYATIYDTDVIKGFKPEIR